MVSFVFFSLENQSHFQIAGIESEKKMENVSSWWAKDLFILV